MSLQLVINLSNEIETIADVDKILWFKRAHVEKFLGLSKTENSLVGLDKCEMLARKDIPPTVSQPCPWPRSKD